MIDDEVAADLSLMLMYLSSWTERDAVTPRFWKGFRFELLDALAEQGLIVDSRRAKSASLTEAGVQRAQMLLERYAAPADRPVEAVLHEMCTDLVARREYEPYVQRLLDAPPGRWLDLVALLDGSTLLDQAGELRHTLRCSCTWLETPEAAAADGSSCTIIFYSAALHWHTLALFNRGRLERLTQQVQDSG